MQRESYVTWFKDLSMQDIAKVGGKNSSLGEMISNLTQAGIKVPNGFATTAYAFHQFMAENNLQDKIKKLITNLDVENISALQSTGKEIRNLILQQELPKALSNAIKEHYAELLKDNKDITVAVRSSATLEDLPDASFAGQQETFLNVSGIDDVLIKVKAVFSSLYTDRAIAYRAHHKFSDDALALSCGIQQMVRSDLACSGVLFTLDTESGFDKVVLVTGSYGLGELVVQGAVNPDEFYIYKDNLTTNKPALLSKTLGSKRQKMIFADKGSKDLVKTIDVENKQANSFVLTDEEVYELAKAAVKIEKHYGRPMDIEWAKDGTDNQLYILQARPETVKSKDDATTMERYVLQTKGNVLASGRSIGQKIGKGRAKIIKDISQMDLISEGDVLITDMTDPDWEPVMKLASAIVTNRGGRTCHAAIIARELGIPAVVGCTDATQTITNNTDVTVSCAEGDTGYVYEGLSDFKINKIDLKKMPDLPFKIMLNVGNPDRAFAFQKIPNFGIGLARLEFIINRMIGVHPQACLEFQHLKPNLQAQIKEHINGYDDPVDYYIKRLSQGIATLAAAFYPKKVIVRLSDFKSNEYANLLGGREFEPDEENPMIGFRGASRYVSDSFKACFELECKALKYVRDDMGLTNIEAMIPFVRTVSEGKQVIEIMRKFGLKQGDNGLKIIMMCELPSNALLADEFLEHFDGFSIGSNDLTQLTLGLDRDSAIIAEIFDERDKAVKSLLAMAIKACKAKGKYVGICGQGPSDHPDLAKWLMEQGIDSVSLNPDSVLQTWSYLAENI